MLRKTFLLEPWNRAERFRGAFLERIVMEPIERFFLVVAFVGIAGLIATVALSLFVGNERA